MRIFVAAFALALAISVGQSRAQGATAGVGTETIVFTATKVDASKLSKEERLKHACQAATYMRSQLRAQKTDSMYLETTNEIIQLTCVPPQSK